MLVLQLQGRWMDTVFRILFWAGLLTTAIASLAASVPGAVAGVGLVLAGAIHEASIKIAGAIRNQP